MNFKLNFKIEKLLVVVLNQKYFLASKVEQTWNSVHASDFGMSLVKSFTSSEHRKNSKGLGF